MAREGHFQRKRVALVAGGASEGNETGISRFRVHAKTRAGMTSKNTRRTPGTPLSYRNRAERGLPLTFRGPSLWFAQPLGSPSGQMRNIITKLLIVVVPRRTAGDG
jgi:hypothetical protein